MFRISQQRHGFVRGTPLVRQGGVWASTDGPWTAVVANIIDANTFEATDSGVIDYPPGTFIPDFALTTPTGTAIGTAITNSKLLLSSAGTATAAAASTPSSTPSGLSGSGLDQYYAKWTGTTVGYGQIHEDATSLYLGPTITATAATLTCTTPITANGGVDVGGATPSSVDPSRVVIGGGVVWVDKYLQATPQTAPTHAEGRMYWDSTDHTLSLQSEITGSTLQVGQENWVRCVNKTGSTISDGSVVYISGAQGNRPTMSLALSNSGDAIHRTIGVTTASVANNAEGYVTVLGIVRGINTTGFTEGDILYVSTTTPGALTNVEPVFPNHAVTVGYALNSTVNGSIFVSVDTGVHYQDFHRQQGFNSRTDATLSFVAATRIFTLAPTGTTYTVWREGAEYKLTPKTVTLPATTGLYFIYLDASNTLVASTTPWSISDTSKIFVATVYYYHPTTVYALNDERHGAARNLPFHAWAHKTIGTRYESGLTGTFTNTTLSITQGIIHDEDIEFSTASTRTSCRLWRYNAATSAMLFTASTTPYMVSGGTLQWDNAGTATNVTSGKYIVNDVYATTDPDYPIWIRVGTAEYTLLNDAQAAVSGPLATWNALGIQELKLLYRIIYRNLGGTPTYISATDFRTGGTVPGGGTTPVAPHAATHAGGGSDPISSLGAVTFIGASSTPAEGTVNIGGGIVRAYTNFFVHSDGAGLHNANVTGAGTVNGINLLDTGNVYIGHKSGVTSRWYNGTSLLAAISDNFTIYGTSPGTPGAGIVNIGGGIVRTPGCTLGDQSYFAGTDTGSVSANQVAIGGGVVRAAGAAYIGTQLFLSSGGSEPSAPSGGQINMGGGIGKFGGSITVGGTHKWTLAGYTATAPSATGYITITINGTTYKLLAST